MGHSERRLPNKVNAAVPNVVPQTAQPPRRVQSSHNPSFKRPAKRRVVLPDDDSEHDRDNDIGTVPSHSPKAAHRRPEISWAERQDRQENAWAAARGAMAEELVSNAHVHAFYREDVSQLVRSRVQARVYALCSCWCSQHVCQERAGPLQQQEQLAQRQGQQQQQQQQQHQERARERKAAANLPWIQAYLLGQGAGSTHSGGLAAAAAAAAAEAAALGGQGITSAACGGSGGTGGGRGPRPQAPVVPAQPQLHSGSAAEGAGAAERAAALGGQAGASASWGGYGDIGSVGPRPPDSPFPAQPQLHSGSVAEGAGAATGAAALGGQAGTSAACGGSGGTGGGGPRAPDPPFLAQQQLHSGSVVEGAGAAGGAAAQGGHTGISAAWGGSGGTSGGGPHPPEPDTPSFGPGFGVRSCHLRYIGLVADGMLCVPSVSCQECMDSFTPTAIQSGCFNSSPVDPQAWFDLDVHDSFRHLSINEGLSATGFAEFLEHMSSRPVDDRLLLSSWFAFARASHVIGGYSALGVKGMDTGPFADCRICAQTPQPPPQQQQLQRQEPHPPPQQQPQPQPQLQLYPGQQPQPPHTRQLPQQLQPYPQQQPQPPHPPQWPQQLQPYPKQQPQPPHPPQPPQQLQLYPLQQPQPPHPPQPPQQLQFYPQQQLQPPHPPQPPQQLQLYPQQQPQPPHPPQPPRQLQLPHQTWPHPPQQAQAQQQQQQAAGVVLPSPPTATAEVPAFPLAVSVDAVTKLGHYQNCGKASARLQSQLGSFFGGVDARVKAAQAAGRLDLKSTLADPAWDGDGADSGECSSSLHCARPTASSVGGPCDIHGVVGAVCMHTVPLRGLFCDMPTPEQFTYYLFLLSALYNERPDLQHVYMDFGCRFRSTWLRYLERHPDLPSAAKDVKIMVNWMHASGHDVACQLTNSGRYQEGVGWRVGEQSEQLWSMAKAVGGLVRYMTAAHRRDFLEVFLASIAPRKGRQAAHDLRGRVRAMLKTLGDAEAALAKVEAEALAAGINDVAAAAEEYVAATVSASAPEKDANWQVRYVELLLRFRELRSLQGNVPKLAVVSSASAVTLAAASSATMVAKANTALVKLELGNGMTAASRAEWQPGYQPYDAALCQLVEREVCRCQARVEVLVVEIRQLHSERAAAGCADKQTRRSQSRAKRKRGQVRAQLEEMHVWRSLLGSPPVRLTELQVKELLSGGPAPWATPGSASSAGRRHHGRLYHAAAADVARAREQQGILAVEKVRLAAWLDGTEKCLVAAVGEQAGRCAGRVFLLERHLHEIRAQRCELR